MKHDDSIEIEAAGVQGLAITARASASDMVVSTHRGI